MIDNTKATSRERKFRKNVLLPIVALSHISATYKLNIVSKQLPFPEENSRCGVNKSLDSS